MEKHTTLLPPKLQRRGLVFKGKMVTIDYDGVSTHLMIILMIELGIWVILASGNFIRSSHTLALGGKWLL